MNSDSVNDEDSNSDSTVKSPPEPPPETLPFSFILPVKNGNLLTKYGFIYNETIGQFLNHEGIDLSANQGEEVWACIDGIVTIAEGELLEGVDIIITTENGIQVVYRYVDSIEGLKTGDTVTQGDVIGHFAEARGIEYGLGPHLHIEVYENDKAMDPTEYFNVQSK